MDIGSNIQFYRKRLGLSQEDLGQKLLVSRQTISLWEKGQTMPTIDNMLRLKEIFGISLDTLCGCEESTAPQILPEKEYSFEPNIDNIKELCRFAERSILHRFIITTVISIALAILAIINSDTSLVATWIFLLILCITGFTIRFFKNRKIVRKPWLAIIGNRYVYQIFDDYFQFLCFHDDELVVSAKYYYRDIQKYHYTKQFLILQTGDNLHVLPKAVQSDGIPLTGYLEINPSKRAPGPNVVIWKAVSLIFFIASLATLIGAMFAIGALMERNDLMIQNMWVFFVFLPIPVASIIFGIIAKKKGCPQKKNIVVGIVMVAVLTLYGCFTFIFSGFLNDDPIGVERIEYYLETDIPEYDHISTQFYGKGDNPEGPDYIWFTSDVYFEEDGAKELVTWIQQDGRFISNMPNELSGLTNVFFFTSGCDYLLIYNVNTEQCNEYPEHSGIYRMISLGYDSENMCLHIAEYNLDYTAS